MDDPISKKGLNNSFFGNIIFIIVKEIVSFNTIVHSYFLLFKTIYFYSYLFIPLPFVKIAMVFLKFILKYHNKNVYLKCIS